MSVRSNRRKLLIFLGLTFAASWGLAGAFYALGGRLTSPFALPVLLAYMAIPALVAVYVQKVIYREPVVAPLGISFRLNRWFLAALWLMPAAALLAFGISLLLPGVHYAPGMEGMFDRFRDMMPPEQIADMQAHLAHIPAVVILIISLVQGMVAGATVNAVAAFGEELGWRGLLARELAPLGFWASAAIIGVVWGLWHAPFIIQGYNYPQHPLAGVAMMTAFTLLLTPIFLYVRARAKSVLAAAVIHGTLNGSVGVAILLVRGGSDLLVGMTGLAGLLALLLVNVGLILYDRRSADPIMGRPAYLALVRPAVPAGTDQELTQGSLNTRD